MNRENNIDQILNKLLKTGSEISYLKDLRKKVLFITEGNEDFISIMNELSDNVKNKTEQFLYSKNSDNINYISGISSCIYFPSLDNSGELKLKIIGGNRNRHTSLKIDEYTMFDVASITKLYTLILLFKLEECGYLNLNDKVKDINEDFQNLEDFTINDLVRLHGELRTCGNVACARNKKEAYEILKTVYLSNNTREENKYTDFGAIIISDTIEKIMSKELSSSISYGEIMKKYLFNQLGLNETRFNPRNYNLSGNESNLGMVNDPKCRALGGEVGSAGIFTTSDDLSKLAKGMYSLNYINKNHLDKLGEITFNNTSQDCKGNLGVYVKHKLGFQKTFTPPEFSTNSFSHQGFTGSVAAFDPNNLIHINILTNAIYKTSNNTLVKSGKPIGYIEKVSEYEETLTKDAMLMYVIKEYYNKYCNIKEDIKELKLIK